MATPTEKINAILKLIGVKFGEDVNEGGPTTKADVAYENTAMAKDGMELRWNGELAEGTEVVVVMPTGIEPASDGAHELEDGTIVTMSGGKIQSIAQSVVKEDMTQEEFNKQISELKTEIETLKTSFSEVKLASEIFKANSEKELTTLKQSFAEAVELIKTINETPAEQTPAPLTAHFAKSATKDGYIAQVQKALSEIK